MNPARGGYWHFGFHMQVDLATFLTKGKEAAHLAPMYKMMSTRPDAEELAERVYLPPLTGAEGLRGGFQHYGLLLEDGKANQAAFSAKMAMPMLVLNGAHGLPQVQLLEGALQIGDHVETDIIPNAGHTYAHDNPQGTVERLLRFFR